VGSTLGALLDRHAARIVGRDRELSALLQLVRDDVPVVLFVHGLAGVGKSALLAAFAAEARDEGVAVVSLDGRAIEPTERGFLDALAARLGSERRPLPEVAAALGDRARRTVLAVDHYEALGLLDDWIRQVLLPSVPDTVRLILAGRDEPVSAWPAALGDLFAPLPLGNLERVEADELLRRAGVPAVDAARIDRIARGHPLSLRLAAAALANSPGVALESIATGAVIDELTRLYLAGLDRDTRRALDVASVVRRPTRALLASMLEEEDTDVSLDRLRRLPFVESDPDGLVLHDTICEVVAASLKATDPATYRRYRVAAWGVLRRELSEVGRDDLWRATADALYMLEQPLLREAFFPTARRTHLLETARPDDAPGIAAIAHRHESSEAAVLVETWWQLAPASFRVARGRGGDVDAYVCVCDPDALPHRLATGDPAAALIRDHLRREPLGHGRRALAIRSMLAADAGEGLSPAQAACWLDIKREYLALRPGLRRVYTVIAAIDRHGPTLEPLGFVPVPGGPADIGGVPYHVLALDLGPASIDGWLSRLVAGDLELDSELLDRRQRQLVTDGTRIDLTPLEFDLLCYLLDREGTAVERRAILRDVWGTDWTGGSNVIETVVSALRRKLGRHADMIETVRGLGYRIVQP
jgi:Transcriptional regulatory protein, C terminal/AAA ATPase domain